MNGASSSIKYPMKYFLILKCSIKTSNAYVHVSKFLILPHFVNSNEKQFSAEPSVSGDCTRAIGLWRTKSSGFTQKIGLYRDHQVLKFLHTLEFYKYTLVKNYAKFY